jgi:hypothetical protein
MLAIPPPPGEMASPYMGYSIIGLFAIAIGSGMVHLHYGPVPNPNIIASAHPFVHQVSISRQILVFPLSEWLLRNV